jgi:hypothetical protein
VRKTSDRLSQATSKEEKMKKRNRFAPGWDEQRVRAVLEQYEAQTQEEAVAEHVAA